jgi:predicted acylesterase/phospholipase RssA
MNLTKPASPPSYLASFCLHFVLPNTLLAVAAMIGGGLGAEYGITYLVWHDDPVKQFWVGFAMALVVLQALYIGFMLWVKKAGRPDRLIRYPEVVERVRPRLFAVYCGWVVGKFALLIVVVGSLVLLVQFIDGQGPPTPTPAGVEETDNVPPPRPNYALALPLGGLAACLAVFLGGWAAKHAIRWFYTPTQGANRRMMKWLIDAAENDPRPPARGGLVEALWSARTRGSRFGRVWVALFSQSLCVSVGVVFAAAWELSSLPVAIGVGGSMLLALVAIRARWMNDRRVFRAFILILGCLCYFVVTWLGSRSWCGWVGAFFVTVFLLSVWPMGLRYVFPGPTARLLRRTNDKIIDPLLCRKYPFHGVAVLFVLFGAATLFVLPMGLEPIRSPLVMGCFLAFMFLTLYGFVAYVVDDALPFLAPAMIVLVILSGLPRYKMQFPGLDYVARAGEPSPILDLEATVNADVERQKRFNEAVASGNTAEADRLWLELENENRILPGKDLRPKPMVTAANGLFKMDDIAFSRIPPTICELGGGDVPPVKKPMVVIVASGGGIRAAAWTFLVLSELEARFAAEGIPFPYHVRLISGASGGMYGASYYVRSLRPPGEMKWDDGRRAEMTQRLDKLTGEWLTPIAERLAVNDIPGFFSPFPSHTDRGIALEQAWSKGLDGELDMTFEDLGKQERAGWCPSLAFSPMMVEDGRRLLISNLDLRYPASNDGHLLDTDQRIPAALVDQSRNYSHEALELFRMFPRSRGRFTIATAVRMSASFPFLSPAVPLPTNPRRRVVDAGYFDNYGVSLAASFLFSKKHGIWLKENVSKVAIIQIRDGQSDGERRLEAIPDTVQRGKGLGSLISRALEELTSPVEGLNNARVGTSSFRNDGLLELLSTYFEQVRNEPGSGLVPHKSRYFTVVNFEFPGHVALSWHLSAKEKRQIRDTFAPESQQSADLRAKIGALVEWWKAPVWEPQPEKSRVAGRER